MTALRRIVEVACFTTSPLLLEGESGTGKELVARLFHHLDPREGKRDLIVVDCTTIVPTLSGSEFFGHERGAFTGAMSAREGAFAAADRGTLFLDEIGELPLTMQAELLRVIQEGTYKWVGADHWRKTSFRLVCATNRDLEAELAGSGWTCCTGWPPMSSGYHRYASTPATCSRCSRTSSLRRSVPSSSCIPPWWSCSSSVTIPATCETCASWRCGSRCGTSVLDR